MAALWGGCFVISATQNTCSGGGVLWFQRPVEHMLGSQLVHSLLYACHTFNHTQLLSVWQ
jgi:hypothetical protein